MKIEAERSLDKLREEIETRQISDKFYNDRLNHLILDRGGNFGPQNLDFDLNHLPPLVQSNYLNNAKSIQTPRIPPNPVTIQPNLKSDSEMIYPKETHFSSLADRGKTIISSDSEFIPIASHGKHPNTNAKYNSIMNENLFEKREKPKAEIPEEYITPHHPVRDDSTPNAEPEIDEISISDKMNKNLDEISKYNKRNYGYSKHKN